MEHEKRQTSVAKKPDRSDGSATTLPWDAPTQFRTVPAHEGPLRAANPVGWNAQTDVEAVAVWMAEKASGSTNTAMAYRKEVERFLFWLADKGMAISDATREDYLLYARFLLNPKPRTQWISDKRYKRDDPMWRPFQGPLTPSSAKQSLTIIKSLVSYLHQKGWLSANPMPDPKNLVSAPAQERADQISERQIPPALMDRFVSFCSEWPERIPEPEGAPERIKERRDRLIRARLQVIVALTGTLAARSSDLINGQLNHFRPAPADSSVAWAWHIPSGKGNKVATLPVPEDVMSKISNLRVLLGLTSTPQPGEAPYPIVPDLRSLTAEERPDLSAMQSTSRSWLYKHMKSVFREFSETLRREGMGAEAALMNQASLHWLRHTAIKKITTDTGSLTLAQKLARHSNVNTTADYAKATMNELAKALNNGGQ